MLKSSFRLHQSIRMASTSLKSVNGPFNWINNERVQPVDSSGAFKNLEPRSGKVLADVPSSGPKEVDRAVQSSKEAFKSWSKVYNKFIS